MLLIQARWVTSYAHMNSGFRYPKSTNYVGVLMSHRKNSNLFTDNSTPNDKSAYNLQKNNSYSMAI